MVDSKAKSASRPGRRAASGTIAALAVSASSLGLVAEPADAGCGSQCPPRWTVNLPGQFDSLVDNMDRTSASTSVAPDWPIQMIMVGNAEVLNVKYNVMGIARFCRSSCGGGIKYGFTRDGSNSGHATGYVYSDADGGEKSDVTDYHYRIYADSDDNKNYDPDLGFWSVVSFHRDINEESCNEQFGYSDVVKQWTYDHLTFAGFTTSEDWQEMGNYGFFWSGTNDCGRPKNLWIANGKADKVRV